MKKIFAIILAVTVTFTIMMPGIGFAKAAKSSEPKYKLSDAIELAKKTLGIATDNYNFNYNYNENRDGRNTWDLNWNAKDSLGGTIYASIDADTGEVVNYSCWDPSAGNTTIKIPKYSKDKAYDAAVKFLQKVLPAKFAETIYKDATAAMYDRPVYSDTYNFNFIRKVNGLEFADNGINISVDKNSGKVRNFSLNWDKGPFTDPSKAISPEEAKKAFENKLGIELTYNPIYGQTSDATTTVLVYSLKNGNYPIDAETGNILNSYIVPMYNMKGKAADSSKAEASLTPEEQKAVDDSSKYISKDQAIAEALKYISVDKSVSPSYSYLYVNTFDNSAHWTFSWEITDKVNKTNSYASATVDAVNCKMESFSMSGDGFYPKDDTTVSYTKEQAQKIAYDFINSIQPDRLKMTKPADLQSQFAPAPNKITDYNFTYVGKINGATCSFDSFYVNVNAYSGKIMSYSMNWNDTIKLPSADKAMSLENAYKNLYGKVKLTLKYMKYYNYDKTVSGSPEVQIKLVYALDSFTMFDANDGTFLDGSGKPVVEKKGINYTDIKGNPAENDINILVDMGIIDDQGDKFNPNTSILQKDFIKMLVKSLGPNYIIYRAAGETSKEDYDNYYATAIQKNILTAAQKKPDTVVTRQDAARFIIRAMGLGYTAELPNLYNADFKDAKLINSSYKGYAALASALKIVAPVNGSFLGTKTVSRGETATFIVNYLKVDTNK